MDGLWEVAVSSLQDTCNANEQRSFDLRFNAAIEEMSPKELAAYRESVEEHRENAKKGRRLINTALENVVALIEARQEAPEPRSRKKEEAKPKKSGRSYWQGAYHPSEPVVTGSEVAFRLRHRGETEWIQCEVTRVIGDGTKFEVRDPEPDENGNPGQTYKCTWKDVLLIPPRDEAAALVNYPYGTKVLARYPETTTFYPAEVIGTKRDGNCRLRFEGEEEVGKETEVERRLTLPFPSK